MPGKPRTVPEQRQALSMKVHDDSVATYAMRKAVLLHAQVYYVSRAT